MSSKENLIFPDLSAELQSSFQEQFQGIVWKDGSIPGVILGSVLYNTLTLER